MSGLIDSYQRPINYLRISVTDRCNLRCVYCMPPEGIKLLPHREVLSFEEIVALVEAATSLGISNIRLTGGEPLVRPGIVELVRMIAQVPGVHDLSLTTNGVLLSRQAPALKTAGLSRVNISLDTLRPQRFRQITRFGHLEDVLEGIAAAQQAGLDPVKINVVLLKGLNDDEVLDFAAQTLSQEWHIRFIEPMPVGEDTICSGPGNGPGDFLPLAQVEAQIATMGLLTPYSGHRGNGPARYYRLPGARGSLGFISPLSEAFCFGCNRLRLTADGKLRPCLLSDLEIDVKGPLRAGATQENLQGLLRQATAYKPESHLLAQGQSPHVRQMSQIGG